MVEQLATNFPESLDTLTNPNGTNSLSNPSHAQQHANANDAIEALQTKIGIDGSEDTNSLDYKIATIESQLGDIGNNTGEIIELLGLEGNNDLVVTGIENKTTIDTFAKTVYRTVRYVIQFSRGSEHVSETLDVIQDGTDFHIQEVEISSNTDNILATTLLEENNGIISLSVTPTGNSVNVRYYRTALKI